MPITKAAQKRSYANVEGFKKKHSGAPAAPANTALPAITGTATVGETLTSSTGTWTGKPTPTFARQWKRGGVPIAGATAATYLLVPADAGAAITVTVTADSISGNRAATSTATSAVAGAAPVNTVAPSISGTAQVGETLTASNGTWTGTPTPTYALQWNADGEAITGATGSTYEPVEDDIGKVITVTVTGTNLMGTASASSAATAAVIAA